MIKDIKNAVIISPHPDDETLGVGGTIKKFSKNGINVSVLVVSGHLPPLYNPKAFQITEKEALKAFKKLGVKNYEFLKIPATYVHKEEISSLYKKIINFINKFNPEIVFIPFPDRHIDHRIIFDGSIVACRPIGKKFPKIVLLYETLSETHWNVASAEPVFNPDFYINVSKEINHKTSALNCYKSQILNNSSRSVDAVKALAKFRGSQNGCEFAEAFKVVRIVM